MENAKLRQEARSVYETAQCMYCGTKYDKEQRSQKIRNPESSNALNCCSNKCLALEDALQANS